MTIVLSSRILMDMICNKCHLVSLLYHSPHTALVADKAKRTPLTYAAWHLVFYSDIQDIYNCYNTTEHNIYGIKTEPISEMIPTLYNGTWIQLNHRHQQYTTGLLTNLLLESCIWGAACSTRREDNCSNRIQVGSCTMQHTHSTIAKMYSHWLVLTEDSNGLSGLITLLINTLITFSSLSKSG